MLRAMPDRRASEIVSAIPDPADRKMLIDALLKVGMSSAAQAR
jgi:hypothetical protein